jgi:U3 small nucleolar RNA-associated protein 3
LDEEDACESGVCLVSCHTNFFRPVHASRDKVLLDGDSYSHHDGDENDDEVFALKGLEGDESDDDSEDLEEDEEDYGNDNTVPASRVSKSKKKEKKTKQKDSEEEDSEEETWGRGKAAYYSSNAAQLESDDEEGHELEEQEAIRLQRKTLEGMNDEDFGLNDKHEISHFDDATKYV